MHLGVVPQEGQDGVHGLGVGLAGVGSGGRHEGLQRAGQQAGEEGLACLFGFFGCLLWFVWRAWPVRLFSSCCGLFCFFLGGGCHVEMDGLDGLLYIAHV